MREEKERVIEGREGGREEKGDWEEKFRIEGKEEYKG